MKFLSRLVRFVIPVLVFGSGAVAAEEGVVLHWLGNSPATESTAVSWGVPWPMGKLQRDRSLQLSVGVG